MSRSALAARRVSVQKEAMGLKPLWDCPDSCSRPGIGVEGNGETTPLSCYFEESVLPSEARPSVK